jgi:hypothetical protein
MSASAAQLPMRRLNVGVLGLGQRWQQQYRPALKALKDRFKVSGLCDPVALRTEEEARRLDCDGAAGPTELLESSAIDALVLLEAPWYGLWPIQLASRFGKPALCVPVLELVRMETRPLPGEQPVIAALPLRLAGPMVRLRELLRSEIGAPRQLLCDQVQAPLRGPGLSDATLRSLLVLIDGCLGVFEAMPVAVRCVRVETTLSVQLEFTGGRDAQLVRRSAGAGPRRLRLDVVAENGQAAVELPDRVRWTTGRGQQLQRLADPVSLTGSLLHALYRTIVERVPAVPALDDAWRAARCLRAVLASCAADGRRVPVADES